MGAELAETMAAQATRARDVAAALRGLRSSAPRIDPDEWRGPAAQAQHVEAETMLEQLAAAVADAVEAEDAVDAGAAAADG